MASSACRRSCSSTSAMSTRVSRLGSGGLSSSNHGESLVLRNLFEKYVSSRFQLKIVHASHMSSFFFGLLACLCVKLWPGK
jgi:hypothetical protein